MKLAAIWLAYLSACGIAGLALQQVKAPWWLVASILLVVLTTYIAGRASGVARHGE